MFTFEMQLRLCLWDSQTFQSSDVCVVVVIWHSLCRQIAAEVAIVAGDQSGARIVSNVVHQTDLQEFRCEIAAIADENINRAADFVVVDVLNVVLWRNGKKKRVTWDPLPSISMPAIYLRIPPLHCCADRNDRIASGIWALAVRV